MERHERQGYLAYMLRLWRVEGDGAAWRASLEDVSTGERRSFVDLDELVAHLKALTAAPPRATVLPENARS